VIYGGCFNAQMASHIWQKARPYNEFAGGLINTFRCFQRV